MKQVSIIENYILTENFINTFLESSEEIEGIDEASVLDGIISKIKSIPKGTKLEIKKRTPEEQKKFKETKQYKNLKAKLEKRAAKTIAKESGSKGFTLNDPEVIKKHRLFILVSAFLELIVGFSFLFVAVTISFSGGMLGMLGVIAYQSLRSTEAFAKFLDACNALIKSKTPSVWEWLNKVEKSILEAAKNAAKNENEISGKDESYTFVLDY